MKTLQNKLSTESPRFVYPALAEMAVQDRVHWLVNQLSLSRVRVTPFMARQRVNVLVSERVSGLFLAGEPTLQQEINTRGEHVWCVPVDLTLPKRGRVGRVGEIEVDAYYGILDINEALLEQMAQRAERLMDQLERENK